MSTLWDRTLAELRQALPNQDFAAWISCLRMSESANDAVTIEAPSIFHRDWVQRHYLKRIRNTVVGLAGRPLPVVLAVGTAAEQLVRRTPLVRGRVAAPSLGAQAQTFQNFVVGPCNQLAFAAARVVVDMPGVHYNPLFIQGGVGLGKTHLINAVANDLRAGFKGRRVLAIAAELFANEMVSALGRRQMDAFRQRFRRIDALLVDDIEFIAGKERTQEEFLHTFNLLCAAGKQIVLSSDQVPRAISNLETALRSRFEGGMIAEVTPPDRETRRKILAHKAALVGIDLAEPVLDYLAERIRAHSVRELEGAVTRLRALAAASGQPIDLALAREAVEPLYAVTQKRVSAERVEELVGSHLGIDPRQINSPLRGARVVFARQVAMYLMRKTIGLPFAEIGERYGRDHTTVLHASRVIEARRTCDPEVRRLVSALEEKL